MATTYVMSPITLLIQFFSNVGIVLNGGFVQVYQAGTTTPQTTYTDSTGTVANANPIALSAAGRLVAAGTGAPVAVWVPSGTPHKMVVTDSGGNFVVAIDNLNGLNDVSSVLTQLAAPTSSAAAGGADLVANAVKSALNFAAVRAMPIPAPVSGQTVMVIASGQTTSNDTRGGAFIWSASSTATDDNFNVLLPTAGASTVAGRWIRVSQPYLPTFDSGDPINQGGVTQGTFTAQLTGFASNGSVSCTYYLIGLTGQGAIVVLVIGTYTATSTAATMTLTGLPAAITPAVNSQNEPAIVGNSAANVAGNALLTGGSSVIQFGVGAGAVGGFATSGTKGLPVQQTIVYQQS